MSFKIPVSHDILQQVARLDQFRGRWSSTPEVPPDRLARWKEAATIQSVASSCRIAGLHIDDAEVATVLHDGGAVGRDAAEIRGYADSIDRTFPERGSLLTLEELQQLNARILGAQDPVKPSPLRETPLHHEAFDGDGRALGLVFQTLPPRLLRDKAEELLSWLEMELHSHESHPLLVVAAFALGLLSASPFEHGSGRTARVVTGHLLRRIGFDYIPYVSFERIMEEMRVRYYEALDASQTHLWTGEADLAPWVGFFLEAMGRQRERLEFKAGLEVRSQDLPPLQRRILETVREHGTAAAALLLASTGANRNTLKDNLRRLVDRRLLERIGQKRGTYYRLAAEAQDRIDA